MRKLHHIIYGGEFFYGHDPRVVERPVCLLGDLRKGRLVHIKEILQYARCKEYRIRAPHTLISSRSICGNDSGTNSPPSAAIPLEHRLCSGDGIHFPRVLKTCIVFSSPSFET